MKKQRLFLLGGIGLFLCIIFVIFMFIGLSPVSKNSKDVYFTIAPRTNKLQVINNLKKAGLIKSRLATTVYVVLTNKKNIQAGEYRIDKSFSSSQIIKQLTTGKTRINEETIRVTFVEGLRFDEYASIIADKFGFNFDDVILKVSDKDFLNTLINKYWFITDEILDPNIYYPLEGYVFPNTYEFYKNSSIEDILTKLIDAEAKVLDNYKNDIEKSSYSVHEILTVASIAEKEALHASDRKKVTSVLYNRLDLPMALGCDVTTYYGAKMDLDSPIYPNFSELNSYNTRNVNFLGLPVSPICSPSKESIEAAISPSKTDYYYFVADKKGDCHFYRTATEFNNNKYTDMAIGG